MKVFRPRRASGYFARNKIRLYDVSGREKEISPAILCDFRVAMSLSRGFQLDLRDHDARLPLEDPPVLCIC